ncbi:hypothetical protein KW790_02180 [Candidatus Parcubacteria bacterium]|nr:hypothetical protein [Candidatus Parcubacteria bacterium]
MSVQFDEQPDLYIPPASANEVGGLAGLIMKTHIVTTQSQAEKVLLGLALAVFATASLIFFTISGGKNYNPSAIEKAQIKAKFDNIEATRKPPTGT